MSRLTVSHQPDRRTLRDILEHAQQLARSGEIAKAISELQGYLDVNAGDSRAWRALAKLNQSGQRADEAIACAERALRTAPLDPELLLEYALYLVADGRRRTALDAVGHLRSAALPTAALKNALGTLLTYCDEPSRALESFDAALTEEPQNIGLQYNRASVLRALGDLGAAELTLDRIIAIDPCHGAAHLMRSGLRVQTADHNHVMELQAAATQRAKGVENSIALRFALGKELEDLHDFAGAFGAFESACRSQRRRMRYDISHDIAVIDQIIQSHTRSMVQDAPGFDTEEPIFVMGLPRSGTTLVAQILAGHSAVYSAGETPAFAAETIREVRLRAGRTVDKKDFARSVLSIDARELGSAYLEATRPQTGHTPRFVDKTPINYLYAGLIARSLPGAKLVAVTRDPMDVCFSMFKTWFTGAYPFSYDLSELGQYYCAWNRLMQHWRDILKDRLLFVQYEELVADQAGATRRLLSHCGLNWEESCLRFHEQTNSVTTASAAQIRRQVYSSSVGSSEYYAHRLVPLKNALRPG